MFDNQVKERFVVFWLNAANVVTGFEIVSEGILNASIVAAREIFRGSIAATAANIIVAHNHPSGNRTASKEDISITTKLVEAGKLLEIRVFDHIIFTDEGYKSFVEDRLI